MPIVAMPPKAAMLVHGVGHRASTPKSCQVLGDGFGVVVQGLLFAVCCGSLLLKWNCEKPRRKFRIFLLDSSKQLVGAGTIHVLNMLCAMFMNSIEKASADECAWYWLNIVVDTTFGVGVCWALLRITENLFGYSSGHYGKKAETGIDWENEPDYYKWLAQISVWCVIVSVMKLIVVTIFWIWAPWWEIAGISATHWIKDTKLRLVFVMIITPTLMNMFQFWVSDSFLKYAHKNT